MNADWARQHVESIFPLDPDQQHLLDAAWDGYLGGGRLTTEAWNLIIDVYIVMVDRLDPSGQDNTTRFRATALGRHLINLLWNGQIDLDSHNGLLRRYYAHAPAEEANDLLREIGVALNEPGNPDTTLIARLTALWEFRVEAVRNGAEAGELAEFGRWFASGHFDPEWSTRQLLVTLTHAGDVEAEGAMLSKVTDLAPAHIQNCLTVLERWIRSAPPPWELTHNLDSIRQILSIGTTGNSTAVTTSTTVISLLARDHSIDLRDLLPDDTTPYSG
jgi:hypothetical protein